MSVVDHLLKNCASGGWPVPTAAVSARSTRGSVPGGCRGDGCPAPIRSGTSGRPASEKLRRRTLPAGSVDGVSAGPFAGGEGYSSGRPARPAAASPAAFRDLIMKVVRLVFAWVPFGWWVYPTQKHPPCQYAERAGNASFPALSAARFHRMRIFNRNQSTLPNRTTVQNSTWYKNSAPRLKDFKFLCHHGGRLLGHEPPILQTRPDILLEIVLIQVLKWRFIR